MGLLTTTIGAYPKPDFIHVPDWFRAKAGPDTSNPTDGYLEALAAMGDEAEAMFERGVRQVVEDQVGAGIDIPTDGEIRRENYIHYHCRHLDGISFDRLTSKEVRGGTYRADLPSVVGKIQARDRFLAADWAMAQAVTERPVKITLPGPMTIADTTVDLFYNDHPRLCADLAAAVNVEVRALAEAGCTWIQIDEPVFARKPDIALSYGIDNLERCFHGVPKQVIRTMHMCCGYPDKIDRDDYPKAELDAYTRLAGAVDRSCVDVVSIEDAHRYNDLSLLDLFTNTKVIFGVVAIAKSRVEPVEEIKARLEAALEHIEPERLIAAPDCGLGILGRDLALMKLRNLCTAAHAI